MSEEVTSITVGSVTIDLWTYGPDNGMVRRLRFIDGRLVNIDSSRH